MEAVEFRGEDIITKANKNDAHGIQGRLENLPGLRPVLQAIHKKRFAATGFGAFRGVFPSFEAARLSAPADKPLGFNNESYAREYADRRERIFDYDYPVLFWMTSLMRGPVRIFDFGGHCGTHFYGYSRYLSYPPEIDWTVCDLEEIVRLGADIARERGEERIRFTTRISDANGTDVFLAAGSLQYVDSPPFAEELGKLPSPPQHLLLNKLPLHPDGDFITLQNGGVAYHPMRIFKKQAFVDSIRAIGYELVDEWPVTGRQGRIPFHPEASFGDHTGLYFRLAAGSQTRTKLQQSEALG